MSAFAGLKVLDCSQGLVGPMAAMHLGDFGAEVLKVEPPGGDRAKDRPGYLAWNRNKSILTLDLADAADRPRFDQLLAAADVLVVDHGPGALAVLGLEGERLCAAHPRLVHLWTPPYGTTGAWSDLPAHHATLTGLTGAAFRQGAYKDQPVWHVAPIAHYVQTLLAAAAAAAALYEREQTGRGQTVVVSGLNAMAEVACQMRAVGEPSYYRGSPTGGSLSYRLYQCGDGEWLFLGALFSHFFYRALDAVGLLGGDVYDMGGSLEARLMSGPRDHWVEQLQAAEVPAGPVRPREAWLGSEIARANDLSATLQHQEHGPVAMPGVLAKLRATPGAAGRLPRAATDQDIATFVEPRPIPPAPAGDPQPAPLAGVRVLDLGTVIAGAYAGSILANFGADVVKVESPDGDPFRSMGGGFMNYNRGKRGLGLDLKPAAGRALFHDLASGADVVLDNYRLGVRERLGIDYATLAKRDPRIISCSATTYGSKGSIAHLPGFDAVLQAWSGQMAAQGGEGDPVFHSIPINDVATAALTAFGIIAALYARERTGEGQDVETSLAAASTALQFAELVAFEGAAAAPQGSRDCIGFSALERYYPCQLGWVTLACMSADQFEALAGVLGRLDWLDRWPAAAALAEPREGPLARAIAQVLAKLTREDVVTMLAEAGVPCAPVLHGDEPQHCEFFWDNGYYALYAHPWGGELIGSKGFATFNGTPASFQRLCPGLGEHVVEVLSEYGVPRERMVELAQARVIFRG